MNLEQIDKINDDLAGKTTEDVVTWAAETFGSEIALASSLSAEDQVLTAMIATQKKQPIIFTLDTGRLFQETYDLIEKTEAIYKVKVIPYFPDATEVEEMVKAHGINLFTRSIELRKKCCGIRKVKPLNRALSGKKAWMTGMRKEQSETREDIRIVEWDEHRKSVKVNPLANWTREQVWDYVRTNNVPYNVLHDKGFPSIGCASCTRAVKPGEDPRAGRWWWERPEQKECGLHFDI